MGRPSNFGNHCGNDEEYCRKPAGHRTDRLARSDASSSLSLSATRRTNSRRIGGILSVGADLHQLARHFASHHAARLQLERGYRAPGKYSAKVIRSSAPVNWQKIRSEILYDALGRGRT